MRNLTNKGKQNRLLFSLFFIFTFITMVNAQYYPISMDEKLQQSSLIIEGKVVNKEAFRHENHIYTKNHIEVIRAVKGDVLKGEMVEVITSGGTLDDVTETWTHMPELTMNQKSFFFLRPASQSMYSELNLNNVYEIYSGVQGIYNYSNDMSRTIYSQLESYRDVELFYKKIGIPEYASYTSPGANISTRNSSDDTCVIYNIRPVSNSLSDSIIDGIRTTNIQLDLYIKVSSGSFRLYNANLETYYNTTIFGTNVVANGKITSVKSAAFSPNYTLTLTDEASDKIKINLLGSSMTASSLQLIDTGYSYVARFTIEIIGWDGESPLEWDELTVDSDKYSEEGTNVIRNFGCERLVEGLNCGMKITSMTDIAAAGAGEATELNTTGVLEINGEGFLDDDFQPGNCIKPLDHFVKFTTIHNQWIRPLEGDYLEYTDTKIRVKVPTIGFSDDNLSTPQSDINDWIAATGVIKVCRKGGLFNTECGCNVTSDEDLFVPFSFRNDRRTNSNGCLESKQSLLRDENSNGGYTMRFQESIKQVPGAVASFKRALDTWRCETLINMDADEESSQLSGPGICAVRYAPLSVGTLASTTDNYSFCGDVTSFDFTVRRAGFLITINSNYQWHTGTDMPALPEGKFDMETRFLHELGHGFTMLHTINDNSILRRPSLQNYNRSFSSEDKVGGISVGLLSSQQLTTKCSDMAMELIDYSECMLGNYNASPYTMFRIYPNPANRIVVKPQIVCSIIFFKCSFSATDI